MSLLQNLPAASLASKMKKDQTCADFFAAVTELQSIENVFAGVEQSQMIMAPASYPTANLTKKIAELREVLRQPAAGSTDDYEIEIDLLDDLDSWRKTLLQRDQAFTAFDLRSYCSNAQPPLDNSVYADLAGFYRLQPPSAAVLSKFDFVITQFFSRQLDNNRRAVRFESNKIVEELNRFNFKWTGAEFDAKPIKSQIHKALISLSKLSAQAKSHKTLNSWIENEFFDYSREVKHNLSETFFVPEVTTGIIICNLVVGNHFASLCETDSALMIEPFVASESEEISENSIPLPNPPSKTLFYSSLEDDFAEALEHERLSNLCNSQGDELKKESFLTHPPQLNEESSDNEQAVSAVPAEVSDETETEVLESDDFLAVKSDNGNTSDLIADPATDLSRSNVIENEIGISGKTAKDTNPKIAVVLVQLSNQCPNRELIKDYLQQSVTTQIRDLKIDEFLDAEEPNSENKNIIEALRVIIRAEDATRIITSAEISLSRKFQDEVTHLLEEIQDLSNTLRRLMSETVSARGDDEPPQKYFETMLYATNTLVEAQLRLNTALIRWQNKEEIRLSVKNQKIKHESTSDEESIVDPSVYNSIPQTRLQIESVFKNTPNKWLMSAALAIGLLGIAWFAFYPKISSTSVTSAGVQTLDPKLMIGGANLIKVKVSKNTLFGFVNNEWGAQTTQQKKDNLRLLVEEGSKYGYNSVLLINQNGDLVGNAAETEINLR